MANKSIREESYFKNFQKYLKEDEVDNKLADLSQKFDSGTVTDYVSALQKYSTDPKVAAVLKAGETDKAGAADERFKVSGASLTVKDLKPTQNEIGAAESLKNILTDEYGSLEGFLKGSATFPDPIIVYNGEFIIDGHHRWSQVYAANPNAKIPALNIQGNLTPDKILKAVHTAIAADAGQTKTINANLKAGNLLTFKDADVYKMVEQFLIDKARNIWKKYGHESDNEIAQYIAGNVREMIAKSKPEGWAPSRASMPQPGASGADDWSNLMKQGSVNFIKPVKTDARESIQKRLDKYLQESINKLK